MKTQSNDRSRRGFRRFVHSSALTILTAGLLASPAQAALLVDYQFTEGSGTAVNNSGTLGDLADGTLTGGWSTTTPSGTGSSVSFDGTSASQGVTTGSAVAGLAVTTISGALWVNFQTAPEVSDRLISTWNTGLNAGFDLSLVSVSGGNFTLQLALDNDTNNQSASISQNLGGWTFVAFTYDGNLASDNVKLYIGTTSNSVAQSGATANANVGALESSAAFEVANTAASASIRTPNALFDNVRIYDTVLTQAQLETLRATDVIPEPSTLAMLAVAGTALILRRRRQTPSPR
jgi:hypothetical protein